MSSPTHQPVGAWLQVKKQYNIYDDEIELFIGTTLYERTEISCDRLT